MTGAVLSCPGLCNSSAGGDLFCDIKSLYGIDIDEAGLAGAMFRIEKSDDNENHIIYITGIYDYITGRGFKNIFKLHKTTAGKYYACRDDGIYLLYEYPKVYKLGFSFNENGRDMVRLLADFHCSSEGYMPPPGGKVKSCWGRWIEEYKKALRVVEKYQEQLKKKHDKSPFETIFMSGVDVYAERMEESISLLKNKGYLSSVEKSMKKHQICLDSFRQSNFFSTNAGMFINSLDKCRYDIREKDIAELLGKLSCSCTLRNAEMLAGMLDEYDRENPLETNSIDIIKAFLLFPYEYVKVCSKYMKDGLKRSEGECMGKLQNAMMIDDMRAKIAGIL